MTYMRIFGNRIAISIFMGILLVGFPCRCQWICISDSQCEGGIGGYICCQPHAHENDSSQNNPNNGCCCELGLCVSDDAKLPTIQSSPHTLESVADRNNSSVRSWILIESNENLESVKPIYCANLSAGILLPELPSLVI